MLIYLTEICNGSLDHYLSGKKLFETMQVKQIYDLYDLHILIHSTNIYNISAFHV